MAGKNEKQAPIRTISWESCSMQAMEPIHYNEMFLLFLAQTRF